VAEEFLIDRFNTDIGTHQLEKRVQKGDNIPLDHIKSFRVTKEEIMYNWLLLIRRIIETYFIVNNRPYQQKKLFQYKFSDTLFTQIQTFLQNFWNLPLWSNHELSLTVFGGKQNYDFWATVFETGKSPQGISVLTESLNPLTMIQT
jgi:hypothetical protein